MKTSKAGYLWGIKEDGERSTGKQWKRRMAALVIGQSSAFAKEVAVFITTSVIPKDNPFQSIFQTNYVVSSPSSSPSTPSSPSSPSCVFNALNVEN
ncbi:uncharacterized protein MONOS_18203 [Monocercomonoides exilis]|uniref:uncharacterized protein n=1 Tax=Monocercomonoides exilis TaxID=2049356 RepID=UPI003559B8E5|nr:hypothetical protein MONOS_18203 [Monocercomonoides exilis]